MRLLGVSLATALLVAACGGAATTASPTPIATTTASPTAAPTIVAKVATDSSLGKILVDLKGMTLYTWAKDTDQNSQCYDQCATFWPAFTATAKILAADGLTTGQFGTSARKDGTLQVTFNSHPLYFFARDTAPGQTNGQGNTGFGAVWTVVQIP
jgi:predicted lipoprotein with Yx(FWY)xxD motif